ncbi:hypothetical protein [Marinigracilibium pacificum]|uniref:STAS/SEC14 domain-containing protein n=1 Tax=Marinigracilibium pacificum TaxID=2729599 RepID=A0A848IVZ7_9BACT|nr:hypothetical protein [Marinigracilibium pacificum]NMM47348.1 hypothetical protein [Marinigracilibium pacificum]
MKIDDLITKENIVFEKKFVTGYYSSELKLFGIVWDGIFKTEDYIQTFDDILEFAKTNPAIGFYTDIRKQGVVSIEARKYFEKHVSPAAQKLGFKKTGVVTDSSPFKRYYLNTLIAMTGRPSKLCSNPEDAIAYLLED